MAVDRRRLGKGDRVFLHLKVAFRAACGGMIALNVASCACDMPPRIPQMTELSIPVSPSDEMSRPAVQRRLAAQQTPLKETHRNDGQHDSTRGHPFGTTAGAAVPRPRTREKENALEPADAEKEQLFREFEEWQRQRRDTP